jgi:3'-phosphoadenosine 5'-phosphosulfate sulfotransferase
MSTNESSRAIIEKKVGKYEWKIGSDGNAHRDTLMSFVTVEALENLVYFNTKALGLKSVFKIELGLK